MELNKAESSALNKKLENPKAFVKCPRCGSVIEYKKFDSAILVKCPSDGCIRKSLRGI